MLLVFPLIRGLHRSDSYVTLIISRTCDSIYLYLRSLTEMVLNFRPRLLINSFLILKLAQMRQHCVSYRPSGRKHRGIIVLLCFQESWSEFKLINIDMQRTAVSVTADVHLFLLKSVDFIATNSRELFVLYYFAC